jgi:hypothetical protein
MRMSISTTSGRSRRAAVLTSPKPEKPRNQAKNDQPDPKQGGVKRRAKTAEISVAAWLEKCK